MTRIYIFRHAEAEGNYKRIFQGHIDGAVSENGRRQLERLRERCRSIPLTALYSSPLCRAMETAQAVNFYHGLDIETRADLMEINGGLFEGNLWEQLPELFPEEYERWENRPWEFSIAGGESMAEVYRRMRDALTEIAQQNEGRTVGVVSHGCAIRNFLCYASGLGVEKISTIGWADNTAVSCVDFDPSFKPHIVFANDNSHLSTDISTLHHQDWWQKEKAGQ